MPVFHLSNKLVFPPVELAEEDGLLAIGGDLREERLLLAYSKGIFPWYSEKYPILWWSPDPRLVLFPHCLRISRSLRQEIKKHLFSVTFDNAFERVIRSCSEAPRKGEHGTWITPEMIEAYIRLHSAGYAHSVEVWLNDELAGGLYGVSLGRSFFGESMFSLRSGASKISLVKLTELLIKWDFNLIDCQVKTGHLLSMGAEEIPRARFINMLKKSLDFPTRRGSWARFSENF